MIINIEKFISSLIDRSSGITQQIFHSDLLNALKEQGLEYKNGEIVKSQRTIAAETKEAIFDDEDEKIRKELIAFIKKRDRSGCDYDYDKWIAWLEKQKDTNALIQEASEKAYTEGIRVERKHWLEKQRESTLKSTLIKEIKRRKELLSQEKEKAVSSSEKLSLGGRIAMLEELLVFANEKQDEQKPILDFKASNWYVSKVDGKIHDLTYNPTDKVKSMFKVGDWIIDNNIKTPFLITSISNEKYDVISIYGTDMSFSFREVERFYHLWTIQDAKAGDIIVDGNFIGIFKENNYSPSDKSGCMFLYCSFDISNDKFYTESGGYNPTYFYPATKRQRDALIKAMADAGYTFDFDKKELKKIESTIEQVNDEDYGIDGLWHAQKILEKTLGKVDGYQSDDGILEHKCAIAAVNKICKQKPAWSEEDEDNLRYSELHFKTFLSNTYYDTFCNWLKSLKVRLGGK